MSELITQEGFTARRTELDEALRLANEAHAHAAFKKETGTGTAEEVKDAKDHVEGIQAEIESLKVAWEVSQTEAGKRAIAATQQAWSEARSAAEKALKERALAAASVVTAAKAIGEGYAQMQASNHAFLEAVRPYAGLTDNWSLLRASMANSTSSANFLLAGILANAGVDFDGVNFTAAGHQARAEGVDEMLAKRDKTILSRLDMLAPAVAKDGAA